MKKKIESTFNKIINNKNIFIISVILVFILVFVLNHFTPLIADDYSYSFGLNGKINSIKDIIDYQVHHWQTWGGRSIAHSIAQLFLILPKLTFNICNSLVYVLFTLLLYKHIVGKSKVLNPALYIIINLLVWFILPVYGQNMIWLIGSCNYLWMTTFVLAFLLPYRLTIDDDKNSNNFIKIIVMFLFGIIAGWSNENTSAVMLLAIIIFIGYKLYNKKKISLWYYSGFIGSLIGFLMMILAPGNSVRSESFITNRGFLGEMIHRFIEITNGFVTILLPLFIIFIIVTIISYYHGNNKKNSLIKTFIYLVLSFAGAYSMIISPIFPERSWMAPVIFMIIATGYSLKKSNKDEPIIKTLTLTITPILLLVFEFSYYRALNDTIKLNNNWKDRIEYIEEEKSKGNKDIEVYRIIPIDKHVALYNLEDLNINPKIWPNNSIARYFDINSIKIKE